MLKQKIRENRSEHRPKMLDKIAPVLLVVSATGRMLKDDRVHLSQCHASLDIVLLEDITTTAAKLLAMNVQLHRT